MLRVQPCPWVEEPRTALPWNLTGLARITEAESELVMERLNNRLRKCLGFKSPNQVFFKHPSVFTSRC